MPCFDMKCGICGKTYEFFKIRSDQEPICKECGAEHSQKKLLSATRMKPTARADGMPRNEDELRNYIWRG